MIVKNEEKTLPRLAESLKGQIDHWTVVDTGSTDLTIDTAYQVFAGIPGEVYEREWQGFGPSRNEARALAEPHTDWLIWLDADEVLEGEIEVLEADWIDIEEINGDLRFWKPRMFRSNRGFSWTGMVHEYLSSPIAGPSARSSRFRVYHHGDGGSRADKFQRDLGLLQQEWEREPLNPRTAFYMARTLDDVADYRQAVDWYRRRLTLGGWDEEVFYTRYRLGVCLLALGALGVMTDDEGCGNLWRAWALKPGRAEPLVSLAEYYRRHELWTMAWETMQLAYSHCRAQPNNFLPIHDGLFVDVSATEWKCAYEQSISAWYTDNKERGRILLDFLLTRGLQIPEPYFSSVLANREFYL